jgi:NitT/TauT family transport system permease protein
MTRVFERHQALISGCISFAVILLTWQLAVDLGLIQVFFTSTPIRVAVAFWSELRSGEIAANVGVSLYELFFGLVLACVAGIGLGVMASWSRTVEHVLEPFIWFTYACPIIAFYPLFIAWLGLGSPTIIAIAFLSALTPLYANTLSGIKNADRELMRAARSFGAGRRDLFLKVALPGSVPIIIAGLRLAVGRALTGVVAGELFGAAAGLGYSIAFYGQKLKTTEMMVSLVLVVILGVILTQLLSLCEAATDSWRSGPGGNA